MDAKLSWWQLLWRSRVAWTFAGGITTFVLLHGVEALTNVRKLPSEITATIGDLQSWLYNDNQWTGVWTSSGEGAVEDYNLSSEPIRLSLSTKHGVVSGEVFLKAVCERNPLLLPVLIDGEVLIPGNVYARAYSIVGGKRRTLATFKVKKSTEQPWIVLIEPLADPSTLLPKEARLQESNWSDEQASEGEQFICKYDLAKALRGARAAEKAPSTDSPKTKSH